MIKLSLKSRLICLKRAVIMGHQPELTITYRGEETTLSELIDSWEDGVDEKK